MTTITNLTVLRPGKSAFALIYMSRETLQLNSANWNVIKSRHTIAVEIKLKRFRASSRGGITRSNAPFRRAQSMLMQTCTHNFLEIPLIRQAFSKLPLALARHYWRAPHIARTFALQHRPFLFMYTSPYGNSFLILTCTQSGEPIAAGKLYLSAIGAETLRPPLTRLHLFLNMVSLGRKLTSAFFITLAISRDASLLIQSFREKRNIGTAYRFWEKKKNLDPRKS